MPRTALEVPGSALRSFATQGSEEARALDAAAVRELAMPSILLMENAARAVAESAQGRLRDGHALVLAGKGNNGGDGLAAARFLAPRAVVALLDRPDPEQSPDAAVQLRILEAAGIPVRIGVPVEQLDALAEGADVIVDALLGTGLESAPRGRAADWIEWIGGRELAVVAVDLPSGLSADSGQAFEPCVRADATVTFARPKAGLLVADGPHHAGEVVVATLGLPEDWVERRDAR